jgi:hypothetical protein
MCDCISQYKTELQSYIIENCITEKDRENWLLEPFILDFPLKNERKISRENPILSNLWNCFRENHFDLNFCSSWDELFPRNQFEIETPYGTILCLLTFAHEFGFECTFNIREFFPITYPSPDTIERITREVEYYKTLLYFKLYPTLFPTKLAFVKLVRSVSEERVNRVASDIHEIFDLFIQRLFSLYQNSLVNRVDEFSYFLQTQLDKFIDLPRLTNEVKFLLETKPIDTFKLKNLQKMMQRGLVFQGEFIDETDEIKTLYKYVRSLVDL